MAPNTSPSPQLNQLMVSVVNDIKAALLALVLQIGSNFFIPFSISVLKLNLYNFFSILLLDLVLITSPGCFFL